MPPFLRRAPLLVVLLAGAASAQTEADYTRWTSGVGQMLARYHAGLAVAAAEIEARGGAVPGLYAGGPYDDGWAFSFGVLEGDSALVIGYGVIVAGDGSVARFDAFDERRQASAYHTLAARALAAVRDSASAFRARHPEFTADAYRVAVLPFPRGSMTAFVSPAQTRAGVTLMGNDLMYQVRRSDLAVDAPTRFHHRLIPIPTDTPADAIASLLVPDAPMPSPVDVQHAMERGAPLVVVAWRGVYRLQPDGAVERLADDAPLVEAARGYREDG